MVRNDSKLLSVPQIATYRSGSAARLAGIPVATLRVWERRYGVIGPSTRPSGHRRYSADEVTRLVLVKALVNAGHPIGAVAHLPTEKLRALRGAPAPSARANYFIHAEVSARENLTNVKRLDVSASMESVLTRDGWKSEFITHISHEMRTPLTSIIGYAEVMLSDPKLPQEAIEEYVTIIRDAGKRLSRFLESYIESEVIERNRKLTEHGREDVSVLAQRHSSGFRVRPLPSQLR